MENKMPDVITAPVQGAEEIKAEIEVKEVFDRATVQAMIQEAINPIAKKLRVAESRLVVKPEPVKEESETDVQNKTLRDQLREMQTKISASENLEKDLIITGQLEKHFSAKGIPADSLDLVVGLAKSQFGSQMSLDARKSPVYKDEFGDSRPLDIFVDSMIKSHAGIGRLMPPMQTPGAGVRGLRGGSQSAEHKPKFEELPKSEQLKMTSLQVRDHLANFG